MLGTVGLTAAADRRTGGYSLGMRRQLHLAARVADPMLWDPVLATAALTQLAMLGVAAAVVVTDRRDVA